MSETGVIDVDSKGVIAVVRGGGVSVDVSAIGDRKSVV